MSLLRFREWIDKAELLTEILGTFEYKLPQDKEQQLYDFYVLSSIWGHAGGDRPRTQHWIYPDDEKYLDIKDKLRYAIEQASDVLFPSLQKEMLKAVMFSITAELRHARERNQLKSNIEILNKELGKKYGKKYLEWVKLSTLLGAEGMDDVLSLKDIRNPSDKEGKRSNRDIAYKAALNVAEPEMWAEIAQVLFRKATFAPSFGGEAWAKIADAWLKLDKAETKGEVITYIDHVYDLQHNTDTVFNKLVSYSKDGSFQWLKRALDTKAKLDHPIELIEKVSPSMRKLALPSIRAFVGGKTLEDYYKKEKENEKPKELIANTNHIEYIQHYLTFEKLKEIYDDIEAPESIIKLAKIYNYIMYDKNNKIWTIDWNSEILEKLKKFAIEKINIAPANWEEIKEEIKKKSKEELNKQAYYKNLKLDIISSPEGYDEILNFDIGKNRIDNINAMLALGRIRDAKEYLIKTTAWAEVVINNIINLLNKKTPIYKDNIKPYLNNLKANFNNFIGDDSNHADAIRIARSINKFKNNYHLEDILNNHIIEVFYKEIGISDNIKSIIPQWIKAENIQQKEFAEISSLWPDKEKILPKAKTIQFPAITYNIKQKIIQDVKIGVKLDSIKLFRSFVGWGLPAAKGVIDCINVLLQAELTPWETKPDFSKVDFDPNNIEPDVVAITNIFNAPKLEGDSLTKAARAIINYRNTKYYTGKILLKLTIDSFFKLIGFNDYHSDAVKQIIQKEDKLIEIWGNPSGGEYPEISVGLQNEIVSLISENKKISAIRVFREATLWPLLASKNLIDNIMIRIANKKPIFSNKPQ
jgi:hypothetical protein